MEVLSQAKWPLLTDLNVSGIKLTYDALAYLLRGRSSLRAIDLSCCGLTEATCSVLQKASCPLLETLNLDCNDINAASIYRLTGAHWPLLRRLVLSGNVLDMSALRNLSLGDWPDLEQLEVSYHEISYAHAAIGLTSLAHGTWPKLRVLKIDSIHHITHDILQALLSGSEPLWHVMSGASMPACGTGNDDTMIQHNYPCPKLHPVCFPLLEVLELCSTTTSVKIDVGRLAYYPLVCLQFQAQSSNLSSHMTLM